MLSRPSLTDAGHQAAVGQAARTATTAAPGTALVRLVLPARAQHNRAHSWRARLRELQPFSVRRRVLGLRGRQDLPAVELHKRRVVAHAECWGRCRALVLRDFPDSRFRSVDPVERCRLLVY